MKGIVDSSNRPLIDIEIKSQLKGRSTVISACVDTAFDGHLVMPREQIQDLELDLLAETDAILADGSKVTLEAYVCFVEWFGEPRALQVIANDGRFPLLGTGLMDGHILHVDFRERTVTIL